MTLTSNRIDNPRLRRRLLVICISQALISTAQAATIPVDANAVAVAADGQCSLIEAINNANGDSQANNSDCPAGVGSDLIILPVGSQFTLNNSNFSGDSLEGLTGLPSISSHISIRGNGAIISRSTVAGTSAFRLIRVASEGELSLDKITISNGALDSGSGGGILNNGVLKLTSSTVSGNTAAATGGGLSNAAGASLEMRNSTVSGNATTLRGSAGGGLNNSGVSRIYNSTLAQNFSGYGTSIHNQGTITLGNTIVSTPSSVGAECDGTGTFISAGHNIDRDDTCQLIDASDFPSGNADLLGLADNGGPTRTHALGVNSVALDSGDLDLCNAMVTGGRDQRGYPRGYDVVGGLDTPEVGDCDIGAYEAGGSVIVVDESSPGIGEVAAQAGVSNGLCSLIEALHNANSDSQAGGSTDCHAGTGADAVVLPTESVFTLDNNNFANETGPGVQGLPAITTRVFLEGNGSTIERSAAAGTVPFRLLLITAAGSLHASNVTLKRGVINDGTFQDSGGAILNQGTLRIEKSTISFNTADQAGGGIATDNGASTWIYSSTFSGNTAGNYGGAVSNSFGLTFLINSTVSGNSAGQGGGVGSNGELTRIRNSTITGNTATNGGGVRQLAGTLNIGNTILAEQAAGGNCSGTLQTNFANLVDDESCPNLNSASDVTGLDKNADLGPLADNGGPTLTHALGKDSDAIDRGAGVACDFVLVGGIDQRGVARGFDFDGIPNNPLFGDCDIGAYEAGADWIIVDEATPGVGAVAIADDGLCSLVEAIHNANEDLWVFNEDCNFGIGTDTIVLPKNSTLTLDNNNFAADVSGGLNGLPSVVGGVRFLGNGATIQRSTVQSTSAFRLMHVGAEAVVSLHDVTLSNGFATVGDDQSGGAISNHGNLTLTGSTISGNTASSRGGGVASRDGTMTLVDSTVSGNTAGVQSTGFGGGVSSIGDKLVLDTVVISNNGASEAGGGIAQYAADVTVTHSTISGNSARNGGGVETSRGTLTITASTISGNTADRSGGGVYSYGGTITIGNSTISGNLAQTAGGGFYRYNPEYNPGTVSFASTTVAANYGGGLYGSTFYSGGPFNLVNTIVASQASGPNCAGKAPSSNGFNLVDDDSCGFKSNGDKVGPSIAAKLLPLADNGGPTFTHKLDLGSQAINKANSSICAQAPVLNRDQRGFPRLEDCDIGSFELGAASIFSDSFEAP